MADHSLTGRDRKDAVHPRPERPTEPNAGILRLEPGAHHPLHQHDFPQVWYIPEGRFVISGREYGPGTMIFHPDPHYEDELRTETGARFSSSSIPARERRPVSVERTDR